MKYWRESGCNAKTMNYTGPSRKKVRHKSAGVDISRAGVLCIQLKHYLQRCQNGLFADRELGMSFSTDYAVFLTLSSPRAESARAFTGRRNSHSGRGEDFLSRQPNFFTETAVTPERKVEKSFPRWEINRHAEG